jgi:predicted DCC family thiol-disulfide oxidoreductase YuxK
VRDRLYNVLARNRLRWFGSRETCFLPRPADADRFLQ